jgi:hypothetical protein
MHASISSFTFGAEFEVLVPGHLDRHVAARELSRRAGLPVHSTMTPAPSGFWKVVNDMSVRGSGVNGLEFVSPILKGDDGLDQVRKIADALLAMGCTVNQTCGFHVHVGNHGGQLDFYKSLVKLYARFEDVLDSFMPPSRRANSATYCRSIKLGAGRIDDCRSASEIAMTLRNASRADAPKYHKVNLVPIGKPTVEFRHHAGTVDSAKAVNWIVKCLRMVAAAREGRTGEGALMALEVVNLVVKTRAVIEMCSQPNGATIREICARFGFSTVSVKRHARLAGVAFTQRGDRYFINPVVPVAGGTAVPVTVDGLAQLLGETDDERAFFAARRAALQPMPPDAMDAD